MSKECVRHKSWVELMDEELEEQRLKAEKEALEAGKAEKGRLEKNKETLKEEEEDFLVKEENVEIEEERLKTKKQVSTNEEQNANNKHLLGKSEECKIDIKEETSLPVTRVKIKNESSSSCDAPCTSSISVNDKSEENKIVVKNFIVKEKIKIEPGGSPSRNDDFSPICNRKETVETSIKIKSEVEDVDDDDRLSKELENIEHELAHVNNKTGDSLDDSDRLDVSMNSITNDSETDTFVHPGIVNGEHRTSDSINKKTKVSSSTQTSPRKNRNARKRKNSSDIGKNRRKYSCRDQSASSSSSSRSSNASDNKTTPRKEKKKIEYESDPEILARRQKQIDYGKNTIGYDRYRQLVPKEMRDKRDPRTPPKHIKYSRRAWDGIVKIWRQQLHFWDPVSDEKESKTRPSLNVSVDVTSSPYKRRIHTSTVSSASGSGSTEDVGNDDFISLDYDYSDL